MTMHDETVDDFHGRILKITGQCHSLGAPFDEDKVVKKILRALPEKFHSKVTSIEDSFNIDDYPLDELIGNLKTYELRLKPEKKPKGVAFKAVKVTEEEDEPLDLALLTKEFKKFLRNKSSSRNFNAPRKNFVSSGSSENNAKSGKGNFKGNNYGKMKCYECGGYGHISTDCGNRKHGNSNNKYLLSTWSDDETQEVENVAFESSLSLESESDEGLEEEVETLKAEKEKLELMWRTSQITWEQEKTKRADELRGSQSDKNSQTLKNECTELKNKVKMLELEVKGQQALNLNLLTENELLQEELKSTQEKFTKFEISSGTASKLFSAGKAHHDTFRLRYSGESSKNTRFVREMNPSVQKGVQITKVVKDTITRPRTNVDKEPKSPQNITQVRMDQGTPTGQNRYSTFKSFIPTCHYCGKLGHIRPRCNERLRLPSSGEEKLSAESLHCELKEQKVLINKLTDLITKANMQFVNKPVWIRKDLNNCFPNHIDSFDSINANCLMACVSTDTYSSHIEATCLVALTALADKLKDFWYVDSGCSRHMTRDKAWFSSFQDECTTGSVTFGDGRKAKIMAQGTVNTPGIPNLKNVLYVEGLTANLISVSHLADDYEDVWFNKQRCVVLDKKGENIMGDKRSLDNCYHIQANESLNVQACLSMRSAEETFELWHRRLGHVNYQDMLKLSTKQCVRGLPTLSGKTDKICGGCKTGKQTKSPHKAINSATTTRVLELLHMDLMGLAQIESIGGKKYMLVIVDDFSRYTWVNFLKDKAETFESFKGLSQRMIIEKQSSNMCLVRVRSDNGTEFKNAAFANYFHELGVSHEFSAPITPQQNGIVESKNRVLLDMARVMLHSAGLSSNFWAEAISTACYTINRVFLRPGTEQTAYELWKGKKPNISYFRVFGSPCYILRDREQLGKFDARSDDDIFLGYSINSRAYRVYNKRTRIVMESINVSIDDHYIRQEEVFVDTSSPPSSESEDTSATNEKEENVDSIFELAPQMRRGFKQVQKDHTSQDVIGKISDGLKTRSQAASQCGFVSLIEPKNVKDALVDDDWISAMQEELN
ncbi:uncharacterized protein LOC133716132 [Rosa rugosa]|uniref:uncharacterized protein LOC133716132 n=1 Tax=Rosa rugosa TaxID=74645 RepID=UPI002B404C6C|nr:uncharacterized protein LOC133716132 [Rosa rugosa]